MAPKFSHRRWGVRTPKLCQTQTLPTPINIQGINLGHGRVIITPQTSRQIHFRKITPSIVLSMSCPQIWGNLAPRNLRGIIFGFWLGNLNPKFSAVLKILRVVIYYIAIVIQYLWRFFVSFHRKTRCFQGLCRSALLPS